MPTYIYQVIDLENSGLGCEACQGGFEVSQRMSEDALEACPTCGAEIQRVIQAPLLGDIGGKLRGPSDNALKQAGFTKFTRNGTGNYEKNFGSGPANFGGG